MDKSQELIEKTLAELSAISKRLENISKIEDSFETKAADMETAINALFSRRDEIQEDIDHLNTILLDVQKTLSGLSALEEKIEALNQTVASLDVQDIGEKLEQVSQDISKANAKITNLEKLNKKAEKEKKNLGKKQ